MSFCKNCGSKLPLNGAFCSNCGEKTTPRNLIKEPVVTETREKVKQSAPKKSKVGIIVAAVIIALAAGGHYYLSAQSKPEKVVAAFNEAIQNEDIKALTSMMNKGQDKREVTEKEAELFLEYLTNEADLSSVNKELQKQAIQIENVNKLEPIEDENGNQLVSMKKLSEKKLFFYDQYRLDFYPIELMVSTNLEGVQLLLNDKDYIKVNDAEKFVSTGFVFPGEHELKGVYQGEYVKLNEKQKLDFTEASENKLTVRTEFETTEIIVYSNFDDAILFVNGKSTGKEIGNIETFGPISTDGSISLSAERKVDGKTEKTEAVKIESEDTVKLLFEEDIAEAAAALESEDETPEYLKEIGEDDMARFMDGYFSAMVDSINQRKLTVGPEIFDLEGKAYEEFVNYLPTLEEKGITEEYLDMKLVDFVKVDGGYNVTTNESYNIFYGDGTRKYKGFESVFFVSVTKDGLKLHTLISTNEMESRDL